MQFSEKELEDWLIDDPGAFAKAVGLSVELFFWIGQQVRVPSGVIDLLGCNVVSCDRMMYVVVELKVEPIRSGAIGQVVRYASDVDKIARIVKDGNNQFRNVEYKVLKYCVGTGLVADGVQYESDACGVSILTVQPSFQLAGPWRWNENRRNIDASCRAASAKSIEEVLELEALPIFKEMQEMAEACKEVDGEILDA